MMRSLGYFNATALSGTFPPSSNTPKKRQQTALDFTLSREPGFGTCFQLCQALIVDAGAKSSMMIDLGREA